MKYETPGQLLSFEIIYVARTQLDEKETVVPNCKSINDGYLKKQILKKYKVGNFFAAALDAELNRKLAEAESRFLQRDQENETGVRTFIDVGVILNDLLLFAGCFRNKMFRKMQ